MSEASERTALLAELNAIEQEEAELSAETQRLTGSVSTSALHAHAVRLGEHRRRVERYEAQLDTFHRQYGPLKSID